MSISIKHNIYFETKLSKRGSTTKKNITKLLLRPLKQHENRFRYESLEQDCLYSKEDTKSIIKNNLKVMILFNIHGLHAPGTRNYLRQDNLLR